MASLQPGSRPCFHARSLFPSNRPPLLLQRVQSSWPISSSEFLHRSLPYGLSSVGALLGFRPSSRHHRVCPLATKVATPSLRSVPRCSQPLDGLLHTPALQACFIPQPRPGITCSGASRSAQRTFLIGKFDLPPCRWRTEYSATEVTVHIQRASTPRPCSVRSSVAISAVIHLTERSLPSSGSDSSRSFPIPWSWLPRILHS